ncbi:hypothetical protein C7999DRAFT_34042 [Corynascus novoguineensis]|uniref:NACHT domain-containing protein n=1 Tax=Corynascus novoguineensis TaxID=1126955 RepID=A0AAN7HMZ2_9PEZI|nr:hypothetical protein C7999DRAFT_34042 [Corynascus novoguineensis]
MQTQPTSLALVNHGLQLTQNYGEIHLPPGSIGVERENRAYLRDLRATDPRQDKTRIEQDKGDLLVDSYRWVLDNTDFQRWRNDGQSRLLWIKGDPGKGKTMLLCGIINELKSDSDPSLLSFFFCQATDASINSATAVLRGLIYLLVDQQESLITHVRKKYDAAGNPFFRDVNIWVALSEIFTDILEDPTLPPTRLIIDALDECIEGLDRLLGLIVQSSSIYSNVKWIVSSRNWPIIEKKLHTTTQKVRLSLELNKESVSAAVTTYIRSKVDSLAEEKQYKFDTRDAVERYLSANVHGTFLWVALVCQELAKTLAWKTRRKLAMFPPGLDEFYKRMMEQILNLEDTEDTILCKNILATISTVYRPITLDELGGMVDAIGGVPSDDEALVEITLEDHSDPVLSVAWSHDTTRLASASYDKTVKIWDSATGECVSTLEGHSDSVWSVAWSHDATRLASASRDETVKIWDPATGECKFLDMA